MAFEPKRLTHPSGKFGDVVVENPTDYSNFLYRDGYVVSEDQSDLFPEVEESAVAAEGEEVDSGDAAKTEPPKQETARERRERERQEAQAAKEVAGNPTDAQGETVPTS